MQLHTPINRFIGDWLNEKRKALIGKIDSDQEEEENELKGGTSNGWSDSHLEDSDNEDADWQNGIRRPGEEFPTEEPYQDEWANSSDDDDDDHGGHMMPIPGI